MIRILLITADLAFGQQLRQTLQSSPDLEVVGSATGEAAAQTLSHQFQADLALVDLDTLGESGIDYIQWLKNTSLQTQAVALGTQADKDSIEQVLQAGAKGYLLRSIEGQELNQALCLAHLGFLQMSPGLFEKLSLDSLQTIGTRPNQTTVLEDDRWPTSGPIVRHPGMALMPMQTSALAQQSAAQSALMEPNPAQDVLLKPSPIWSRLLIWSILSCAVAVGLWATFYKFEEAIPASGQLEPKGAVKDVQPPVSGVVRTILVRDGQHVKKGDILLELDSKGSESELKSLQQIRAALLAENAAYQQIMASQALTVPLQKIPVNMVKLAESRQSFVQENNLYRAQLQTEASQAQGALTAEQQQRLQSNLRESASRSSAAQLDVSQTQKKLAQNQIQLESAKQSLTTSTKILNDIAPAAEAGAIARIQLAKQQEEVQKAQASVADLQQKQAELSYAIAQAGARVQNTEATSSKDLYNSIAVNDKQIADIDSKFAKAILDNQRQLSDTDNRIRQANLTQQYQALRSPSDGVVFDLQASAPGFVATASQPILKIVPSDKVIAKVFITNRDIGFVRSNMPADIRIDAFPFSEFGDIKGTLEWIGSDALPPTQARPYYSFPARIRLASQFLSSNQKDQKLPLQVGMAVQVNIKLRKRTVISVITDQFTTQADRFKNIH
jgi:hemolysin D